MLLLCTLNPCTQTVTASNNTTFSTHSKKNLICVRKFGTLVPEIYFYYFHCEGERKNKPLVESGN
jgi:hypothetical protein